MEDHGGLRGRRTRLSKTESTDALSARDDSRPGCPVLRDAVELIDKALAIAAQPA